MREERTNLRLFSIYFDWVCGNPVFFLMLLYVIVHVPLFREHWPGIERTLMEDSCIQALASFSPMNDQYSQDDSQFNLE